MILWIVLTLMIAVAAVGLAVPLIRPGGLLDRRTTSAEVLKAQLADLDRQAEAGAAPADDIAALRLEVERRALAEGVEPVPEGRSLGKKTLYRLALALAAVVAMSHIDRPSETDDRVGVRLSKLLGDRLRIHRRYRFCHGVRGPGGNARGAYRRQVSHANTRG